MMSAGSFDILSVGMQYLCPIALLLICVLAGIHLFAMRKGKIVGPHAEGADPSEENAATEEPAELFSEATAEATHADGMEPMDFERREQVSVTEVQDLISDEAAVSFVEEMEETVLPKPRGIINIDTLSKNYQANETVTLESLKEKGLVENSVNYVKVLARGVLNKPLKMILLTGGKAIKLKPQRK